MMGQGIKPASHHPITRNMDDRALAEFLGDIRKEVARKMMKLPRHQQFIHQFCPAPRIDAAAPPAQAPLLRVNPRATASTVQLADGSTVYVVDDFAENAEDLVALAQAGQFQQLAGHPYPGPQLALPDAVCGALAGYFDQHLRARLGADAGLGMFGRFSRVTQEAATLDPRQRICHRDDSGLDPAQMMAACVHYLFKDEQLGGTVFFRSLMSEADTSRFLHDSCTLDASAFGDRYGIAPGYMTESNRYFEVIGRLPARWNRAVFYDGGIFHSGDIRWAHKSAYLSGLGRLTINAFFRSRRPA